MRRLRLVLVLWGSVACAQVPAPAGQAVARPEHAGCRELDALGTCFLQAGDRLVVLASRAHALQWRADRGAVQVHEQVPLHDVVRSVLTLAPEARELSAVDGAGQVRYQLAVAPLELPAWLVEARRLQELGKLAEARVLLSGVGAPSPADRARRSWLRARMALSEGELEQARTQLALTALESTAAQRPSLAVDAATTLAYLETLLAHAPERAEAALALASRQVGPDAERRAELTYYEALSARERGDLRSALARLAEAQQLATRLDLSPLLDFVQGARAQVLSLLGRHDEALPLLREQLAHARQSSACAQADRAASLGFAALVASSDENGPHVGLRDEARTALVQSAESAAACDALAVRNAHVNLALLALLEGDLARAGRELDEARSGSSPTPFTALWELEVEGRIALDAGRFTAASSAFARELALARARDDQEGVFRSLVSLGRSQRAALALEAAEQSFREAEQRLDRLVLAVPLGVGRGLFLDGREASLEGLLDVLLARERVHEAHLAARRALAREERLASTGLSAPRTAQVETLLASHRSARDRLARAAEGDWQLSEQELTRVHAQRRDEIARAHALLDEALSLAAGHDTTQPAPPAPGTLQLTYLPHAGAVLVFAEHTQGTRALRVPAGSLEGATLLEPFAQEIAAARRIELRTAGSLRALDLHALPVAGRPLLAHAPVVYALDAEHDPGAERPVHALVIADPGQGLPHARSEGARVAALLGKRGEVELLSGPRASREAVLRSLARSTFVHFAGHGSQGSEPFAQALTLATGGLTLPDVLGLERAPERVVLSACEAGRSQEPSQLTRPLGLAQAFVARGAREVVAPIRVVDDRASEQLMTRLYEAYAVQPDLASALRVAQLALADSSDDAWKSFRAWTR